MDHECTLQRAFDHAAQGKHAPTCVKTQRSTNHHEYMVDSDLFIMKFVTWTMNAHLEKF